MKALASLFLALCISLYSLSAQTSDSKETAVAIGESIRNTLTRISMHAYTMELEADYQATGFVSQQPADSVDAPLPDFAGLREGWNTLHPGGETTCALGDNFLFFVRAADPDRLVVYLHGGGGCWDAQTCDPERENLIYSPRVEPHRHPDRRHGIFDLDNPENPLAGYSMVVVPVCTGDGYLGDRDVTYNLETNSGQIRQFTIHHRGQTNTMAVIDWIYANFGSPAEIFVAGSSAGSLGMPLYANLLAQHYPEARVVGLGDDTGSFGSQAMSGSDPGQWGVPEVLRRHKGWEDFGGDPGQLYIHASLTAPNLRLYQFDHAHDNTQRFYLELTGVENPDVLGTIRANRQIIRNQVPEFLSFTVGGYEHTVLTKELFYYYHTDGHRLRDWVSAIVEGEEVVSVDCTDNCLRPGLVYGKEDLQIVERAIGLLSPPHAWNPTDSVGACPSRADRYSLRCAMVQAAQEVKGRSPTGRSNVPAALWDVIFTVMNQLGEKKINNTLQRFNNNPETSSADIIAVLEEVRDRISNSLPTNR